MSRRVVVTSRAQQHIAAAARWHETQERGLGVKFLETIERRLEMIQRFPDAAPATRNQYRRALLRPFQWGLFYRVEPQAVVVVGVLDLRRDPADRRRELES